MLLLLRRIYPPAPATEIHRATRECKITYPFRNQIIRFAVYSLSAHVIKLTENVSRLCCSSSFQALLFASLALGFQLFPFLAGGFWCFRCPVINTQNISGKKRRLCCVAVIYAFN